MGGKERQEQIMDYLRLHESVSVRKLTQMLFASEATIRRDLNELEKTGLVKRTFGGAMLVVKENRQIPLFVRENENPDAKIEICRRASELIHDGDVIFLDGSSTSQFLVRFLPRFRDLTVITNGLRISSMLAELHIRTWCTGGILVENSLVFVGRRTEAFLQDMHTDLCFLSCKGMSHNGLFTDTSEEETALRRIALSNTATRVMLLTDRKIGKTYLHTLCTSNDLDHIITNGTLPEGVEARA